MSMYAKVFEPTGLTQNEAVTASAETITVAGIGDRNATVLLYVSGTQTAFVTVDGTTPTVDNGIPVAPGAYITVTMPTDKRDVKHIAAGTGSKLYVTPGRGA